MDLMMGLPLDWKCFNGSSHPNSLWPFLMLMYLVINEEVSPTVQDFQSPLQKSDPCVKKDSSKIMHVNHERLLKERIPRSYMSVL